MWLRIVISVWSKFSLPKGIVRWGSFQKMDAIVVGGGKHPNMLAYMEAQSIDAALKKHIITV